MLQPLAQDLRNTSRHLPVLTGYIYDFAAYQNRTPVQEAAPVQKPASVQNPAPVQKAVAGAKKPDATPLPGRQRCYSSFLVDDVLDMFHPDVLHDCVSAAVERQRQVQDADFNMLRRHLVASRRANLR
jgi:hypothetical protein